MSEVLNNLILITSSIPIDLILFGLFTGMASGFFGIGGGTILVPTLLFVGYQIKDAIGIAVVLMFFSSIYGSFLNYKSGLIEFKRVVLPVGLGGVIGAFGSRFFVEAVSNKTLEILFFSILIYAIYRVISGGKNIQVGHHREINKYLLFVIGLLIGFFAISVGVGGSIILVPILAGFFGYPIKRAIATGLAFVMFSSTSGVISYAIADKINYLEAISVAIPALFGVRFGIWLGTLTSEKSHKTLLLIFYSLIASYLGYRIFFGVAQHV